MLLLWSAVLFISLYNPLVLLKKVLSSSPRKVNSSTRSYPGFFCKSSWLISSPCVFNLSIVSIKISAILLLVSSSGVGLSLEKPSRLWWSFYSASLLSYAIFTLIYELSLSLKPLSTPPIMLEVLEAAYLGLPLSGIFLLNMLWLRPGLPYIV